MAGRRKKESYTHVVILLLMRCVRPILRELVLNMVKRETPHGQIDEFLAFHKRRIEKELPVIDKYDVYKNILYPSTQGTDTHKWDLTLYVFILSKVFKIDHDLAYYFKQISSIREDFHKAKLPGITRDICKDYRKRLKRARSRLYRQLQDDDLKKMVERRAKTIEARKTNSTEKEEILKQWRDIEVTQLLNSVTKKSGVQKYLTIKILLSKSCREVMQTLVFKCVREKCPAGATEWSLDRFLHRYKSRISRRIETLDKLGRPMDILFPKKQNTHIDEWDISLLCWVLLNVCFLKEDTADSIGEIRTIRNCIAHNNSFSLPNTDYESYMERIKKSLDTCLAFIDDEDLSDLINDQIEEIERTSIDKDETIRRLQITSQNDTSVREQQEKYIEVKQMILNELTTIVKKFKDIEIPECQLELMINNCNEENENNMSKAIVDEVNEALESEQGHSSSRRNENFRRAVKEMLKRTKANGWSFTNATKGSVLINVKCCSFGKLCELYQTYRNDGSDSYVCDVESALHSITGSDVKLHLVMYDMEMDKCVEQIVSALIKRTNAIASMVVDESRHELSRCTSNKGFAAAVPGDNLDDKLLKIKEALVMADDLRQNTTNKTDAIGNTCENRQLTSRCDVSSNMDCTESGGIAMPMETDFHDDNVPPSFTEEFTPVTLNEGEELVLKCNVSGNPDPTVDWFHNGKNLKRNENTTFKNRAGVCTLTVPGVNSEDCGEYSCRASNKEGDAEIRTNVNVKCKANTISISKVNTISMSKSPPMDLPWFARHPQGQILTDGNSATVECEVKGNTEVIWYKGNEVIQDNETFKYETSGDTHRLIIAEVFPEYSGNYRVEASNQIGTTSSHFTICVTVPDEELPGPLFQVFPRSLNVEEGAPVTFTCKLDKVATDSKQYRVEPTVNMEDIKHKLRSEEVATFHREIAQHVDVYRDLGEALRRDMIYLYENEHQTYDVLGTEFEPIIYVKPTLEYLRPEWNKYNLYNKSLHEECVRIESLEDVFFHGSSQYKEIYITAEAGFGKTAFSKRLVWTWCNAHAHIKTGENIKQNDLETMKKFEFIFFLPLREAGFAVCEMDSLIYEHVVKRLPLSHLYPKTFIIDLLKRENTLVILDGLDEWYFSQNSKELTDIPRRNETCNCTVLTTTRPWKLSIVKPVLAVDKIIQLSMFDQKMSARLASDQISFLNSRQRQVELKSYQEFEAALSTESIGDLRFVPLNLVHLVYLWYNDQPLGKSAFEVLTNIVVFKAGLEESLLVKEGYDNLGKTTSCRPILERKICLLEKHPDVYALSKLAFDCFFSCKRTPKLVFDKSEIGDHILDAALKMGIMCTVNETRVSFQHKILQEYFAALYIHSNTEETVEKLFQSCSSVTSILDKLNVIVFLAHLNPSILNTIWPTLQQTISNSNIVENYRKRVTVDIEDNSNFELLKGIQDMMVNAVTETGRPFQLEDIFLHDMSTSIQPSYLMPLVELDGSSIKSLNVNDASKADMLAITKVLSNLRALQKLSIDGVGYLYLVSRAMSLSANTLRCVSLTSTLDLDCSGHFESISSDILHILIDTRQLESLSLRHWQLTDEQLMFLMKVITSKTCMKQLLLDGLDCQTRDGIQLDLFQHKLQYLLLCNVPVTRLHADVSSLKYCCIGGLSPDVESYILVMLQTAKHLRTLILRDIFSSCRSCEGLEDTFADLFQIAKRLKHLTCIIFNINELNSDQQECEELSIFIDKIQKIRRPVKVILKISSCKDRCICESMKIVSMLNDRVSATCNKDCSAMICKTKSFSD